MTPFNSALLMGMCCLSVCLAQLGMMMYLPGISAITQAMNTSSHLTSLSLPAYLVGMAVPMLIWGKMGGHVRPQKDLNSVISSIWPMQCIAGDVYTD